MANRKSPPPRELKKPRKKPSTRPMMPQEDYSIVNKISTSAFVPWAGKWNVYPAISYPLTEETQDKLNKRYKNQRRVQDGEMTYIKRRGKWKQQASYTKWYCRYCRKEFYPTPNSIPMDCPVPYGPVPSIVISAHYFIVHPEIFAMAVLRG